MNYTKTLLVISFMLISMAGFSQTKGYTADFGYMIGNNAPFKSAELFSQEVYARPGYNFNKRFALRLNAEVATHLFEINDNRDWKRAGLLGLGAGYNVIADGVNILEIGASASNTLGGADWQYMAFDGGVKWAAGSTARRLFIGLGAKYYKSQRANTDNYCNFYVTFGYRFN